MQILHLEIENFLSYAHAEINLADRGLVLIEGENRDQGGSNGSGKTTLLEAICWCLYGRTCGGAKGDQVVRYGVKGTKVAVSLLVDQFAVLIRRYRQHPEFKDQLHFSIDGTDCRGATVKETEKKIVQTLQLDWDAFISVVMFPQGKPGIAAWTDAEQKSVLDTILGLERFHKARIKTSDAHGKLKEDYELLNRDIHGLESSVTAMTESLALLEQQERTFKESKEHRIKELAQNLITTQEWDPGDPAPLKEQISTLRYQLEQSPHDELMKVHHEIDSKIRAMREDQRAEQMRYDMLRRQVRDLEIIDPEAELEKHQTCPSCGQMLPEDARERLYSTFSEQAYSARQESDRIKEEIHDIAQALEIRDDKLLELQDLFLESKQKLDDVLNLRNKVESAEAELEGHTRQVEAWKEDVERQRTQLENLKKEESPYSEVLEETRQSLETQQELLSVREKGVEPLLTQIRLHKFWLTGFGKEGVRSLLMSTCTPFLNDRANVYMSELSEDTAEIQIKTQTLLKSGSFKDRLDFKVKYKHAGDSYEGKSGGERRRADLAILFALSDLAASRAQAPVNLIALDEPFETLDALGCEQVIGLLNKHVVPKRGTVLVISHSEEMRALFNHRLRVIKERGVSRLDETR